MREMMARVMCVLAGVMVIALSALFAVRHNRAAPGPDLHEPAPATPRPAATPAAPEPTPPPVDPSRMARGREVFGREQCGSCHAFGGGGNPRRPLDGVGTRLQPAELRAWITGTGVAEGQLSAATVRRKQRYTEIPADDLDALIVYLQSSPAGPGRPIPQVR
jgi:mono/diheme cytochrome c family protein